MKVKRMIRELNKYDMNAEVHLHGYAGKPVLFVLGRENDPRHVWVTGEAEYDIREELTARMLHAIKEGISEEDFYTDLIEDGFTFEHVGRYLGEEAKKKMIEVNNLKGWNHE